MTELNNKFEGKQRDNTNNYYRSTATYVITTLNTKRYAYK